MKKSLLILALILSMLMISQASFAEGEINIRIDSVPVAFTSDTGVPFIDNNDRTLVPLRVTMESFALCDRIVVVEGNMLYNKYTTIT